MTMGTCEEQNRTLSSPILCEEVTNFMHSNIKITIGMHTFLCIHMCVCETIFRKYLISLATI